MKPFSTLTLAVLTLSLSAASVQAADKDKDDVPFQSATGVISEVRPQDKQIVLKLRKGESITLTADDHSRIDFPKADGKLAQLKDGKRVRVTYYAKDGTNRLLSLSEPRVTLEKIKQGIDVATAFAKQASFKDRDEYKKNLHTVLQDVDEHIDALEAQAEKADGEARKALDKDVQELRRQRETLRKRLADVDAANADNWNEVRDNVNGVIGDVQRIINRTRDK